MGLRLIGWNAPVFALGSGDGWMLLRHYFRSRFRWTWMVGSSLACGLYRHR